MPASSSAPDLAFDPLSADFAADPYRVYTAMRASGQPYYYAPEDTWMLTRYDQVRALTLDPSMLRSVEGLFSADELRAMQVKGGMHDMPFHERYVQHNMLDLEGPQHDRQRKLVFRDFTPALVERQRPYIQALIDRMLAPLFEQETFDFVGDFAVHLPGHVIGHILGVPETDSALLRAWSEAVVSYYNVGRTLEQKRRAEQAAKDFCAYLQDMIAERQKQPRDDLMSRLVEHEKAGRTDSEETISLAMLILMAGHGSTIDVLGSGLHALLRFADQDQRLRHDPGLMRSAVHEMFRFESPLPYFHRFATQDCHVAGRDFPRGTRFGLLYGAANRDPQQFDQADTFDVGRQPVRHIAFGGGAHFCLGNHLARLDMELVFTALHQHFASLELVEEPTYKRGLSVRGPTQLRIAGRLA